MAYELISEELNLWSCSLGDLKAEQAIAFLNHWNVGATLDSLTLFYEPETQRVILNADNAAYTRFETLAIKYLSADEEVRDRVRGAFETKPMRAAIKTLDAAIQNRKDQREMFILSKQCLSEKFDICSSMVHAIYNKYSSNGALFMIIIAFKYGVVQGIRNERDKRKRVKA